METNKNRKEQFFMEKNKKRSLKILCIMLAMLISVSTQTLAATLSTVTGLTANVVGEKAYLTWNAVSGVTGYEVYVNIAGNGYRYLGSCRTNRVTVAGFQKNTDYTIKVRAYRSVSGKKEYSPNYSNEVNIRLSASTSVPAPTPH